MREIPMIFKGWGVRAILKERKTVTRRFKFSGQPGDRIWVKETWAVVRTLDGMKPSELPDDSFIVYKASTEGFPNLNGLGKTRVSLFMQRRFSRILLEVVDVGETILQNISEADAMREGVYLSERDLETPNPYRCCFAREWDAINGHKPGCSWRDNPLVKRIEFKVVEP